MKKILKILFAIMAPAWFAFSCAHAEEVEITPSSSFYLDTTLTQGNTSTRVNALSNRSSADWQYYYKPWLVGPYLANGEARIAYNAPQMSSSDLTSIAIQYNSTYAYTGLNLYNCGYAVNSKVPAFSLDIDSATAILYVDSLTTGWYRYELDFYVGVGIVVNNNSSGQGIAQTLNPSFTYLSSDPYPIGSENGSIQYLGTIDAVKTGNDYMIGTQLLHFRLVDTWEVDPAVENYSWNMQPFFQYVISSLSYAGTLDCSRSYVLTTNNRFTDKLYGNVEPIIPPSPTPTPSPNQDIINNDNTNTTNIISSINDGFDALSAVFEGTIYGLTDLIFGSASDWIDFFSDVQDDMEEYLPVVTFFQSCKNILANFFNVESTNPTALQYIAGWQSDIYTLHIGALPLVLPEGTFNFFPEVNFNLNNPFMNEIRPYWLTFSNVLITLLFLRYLANYLFRWTQLLTGDTSVAFQLFHHAPDELENLGTDPSDLASDYSYDSIDSANHDLYQDAEAHYGHGAARYLSKVFHSK